MNAINLFNKWVESGKDEGMEKNHSFSVDYMLNLIPSDLLKSKFSFLDIGCGNGWLVKKVSGFKTCIRSVGIDGAENMIEKARLNDVKSSYLKLNINNIESYNEKFDIILSMEVFYYLKSPKKIMKYVFSNLLKRKGCFIMGVDFYYENKPSLSWPTDLKIEMCNYSIEEWKNLFIDTGFSNVTTYQVGANDDWSGTLVLYGEKN